MQMKMETPHITYGRVVAVLALVLGLLTAIGFGFQLVFPERIGQTYTVQTAFPLPGVVPDERERRLATEAAQREVLKGGAGRISIDEAMNRIVARGTRAFDPLGAPS
jgi:hypothetical protein